MILYKYRHDSEFTDQIFTTQKVWLSNAEGLNDPFECSIQEIAKDWIDAKVLEMKQGQLMGFIHLMTNAKNNSFYGLSKKDTEKIKLRFKALQSFDEKYSYHREFVKRRIGNYPSNPIDTFLGFDKQLNEVGIFSLSETSDNILMWSHYGDETRGIAIGFEVEPNSKLANHAHCIKVSYSDTLPVFSGGFRNQIDFMVDENGFPLTRGKISFEDETFRSAISTKSIHWSVENEWRYIEEKAGLYPLPGRITEVTFGLRSTQLTKEKYISMARANFQHKVNFFEIKKIVNTNSIERVPLYI